MISMVRVYIGVGSNEGDRAALIGQAAALVAGLPRTTFLRMAAIRETDPVGPPQEPFLNTVFEIETELAPLELLHRLKGVERALGRRPSGVRWGPRPMDLDLLLYGDLVIHEQDLQVPHPRLAGRRFVLEPLADLAPELIHPILGQTITSLYARTTSLLMKLVS